MMKGGNMKFLHLADIHLDMPFKLVGAMGEKRRMMQLDILRKVAEDLYEHEYIKDGTINAFINIIKKMPDTQIFISPGNHDPFVAGSVYDRFEFPANVHIFSDLEVVETEDYNIYGYGFSDFYDDGINLDDITLLDNGKKNILVIHRRC